MDLSIADITPIFHRAASFTHDEISLVVAIINGFFAVWIAFLTRRNKKDIDGVAEVVGTERAKSRCEGKTKGIKR
jgi:hypothetical protein